MNSNKQTPSAHQSTAAPAGHKQKTHSCCRWYSDVNIGFGVLAAEDISYSLLGFDAM
jgi:hypothetical protein